MSDLNNIKKSTDNLNLDVEKELKRDLALKITKNVVIYVFLTIMAFFSLFPFIWMITTSFKTQPETESAVLHLFPQSGWQFSNYKYIFTYKTQQGYKFTTQLINTMIVGFVSTSLGVIVTVLSAFAFAKLEFKGKNLIFSLLLATMMIPGELFTITNYTTTKSTFGWTNTFTILIAPFLISVFYIYLLRNAMKQVPDSLYKAAKVDGCGDVRYLVKVMIPLVGPTIFSIVLLKFIGTWNSYIWPNLVNSPNMQLLSNWVSQGFVFQGEQRAAANLKMAAACLVTIPLLILFLCFRKYIMRGVSRSGTKG